MTILTIIKNTPIISKDDFQIIQEKNNTFVGYNTNTTTTNITNSTALGNEATVSSSNTIVLGNGTTSKLCMEYERRWKNRYS